MLTEHAANDFQENHSKFIEYTHDDDDSKQIFKNEDNKRTKWQTCEVNN